MAIVEVKINGKVVASTEVDDTPAAVAAAQEVAEMFRQVLSRIQQTNLSDSVEIVDPDMPTDETGEGFDDEGDDGPDDDHDPDEEE